jgi:hypothetical protein
MAPRQAFYSTLVAGIVAAGLVASTACQDGPEIQTAVPAGNAGAKNPAKSGAGAKGNLSGGEEASGTAGSAGSSATVLANVGSGPVAAIQYPSFRFNGQGLTHCKDSSDYGPYVVKANVEASASATASTSKTENFNVTCFNPNDGSVSSECEDANPNSADNLAHSDTTTVYTRLIGQDLATYRALPGIAYVDYLIYAKSVTRSDGLSYTFNPPIPTAVWAADAGRFNGAGSANNTWTTTATGGGTALTVHVNVNKVAQDAHSVTVAFTVTIDQGASNYAVYANFPMAHQSIYVINTDLQAIKSISTVSYHTSSSSHCDQNTHTDMTFTACDMTLAGKATPLGCTFGQ